MANQLPSFDVMVNMAKNAPDELEHLRLALVDRVIREAGAEQRRRLLGLQFQVDMVRQRASNPMAACVKISEMMCQSLTEMRRAFDGKPVEPGQPAKVLHFPDPI
ncbi:MAG: DUF3135 domain-containing protein [Gammaproteobacteria bacterium]|nr:DUF3135 domain-containing protein [Gammaproteobacteria bacterium]